jgi:hypothetical protein
MAAQTGRCRSSILASSWSTRNARRTRIGIVASQAVFLEEWLVKRSFQRRLRQQVPRGQRIPAMESKVIASPYLREVMTGEVSTSYNPGNHANVAVLRNISPPSHVPKPPRANTGT